MNHFTGYFLMFDYSRVLVLNFSIFRITLFHESNTMKAPFLPAPSNNKIGGKLRIIKDAC